MNATKPFQLGSISTATLRTEDLLPAFVSALESLSPMGTNHPYLGDAYQILEQGTDDESEASETLSDIEHELNNLCPPFVYFGTLEGDGSDFGFWPDTERLQEELRYNGRPMLGDSEYTYLDDEGLLVHVNDHGNISVFDQQGNLLWDCV